jgi:predicted nucleotide-binding protein
MQQAVANQLANFCNEADDPSSTFGLNNWSSKVSSFLRTALGSDTQKEFLRLRDDEEWTQHALRVGHLQGLIAKAEAESTVMPQNAPVAASPSSVTLGARKVFVVHGHDNEAKETVARFLERLGLEPIILHEQPSFGRTIIEKFEIYSGDIAFSVVLLTPDDVGGVANKPSHLRVRARQNVIMELGYFMGRLGRFRVCALHKGPVELPSDYQGVLYIELDTAGAWKTKLAQEFVQAKLPIELSGLLNG